MDDIRFQWDAWKALANERKHGVSFEEAKTVFADENALLLPDRFHHRLEERYLLLGISSRLHFLVVVHAAHSLEDVIRIISARKATAREREQYIERNLP